MKFLLVTESHKIFIATNIIITTIVIARNFTFFRQYVIFSTIKGITNVASLERLQNWFVFRRLSWILHPLSHLWKLGHFIRPVSVKLWFDASVHLLHSSNMNAQNGMLIETYIGCSWVVNPAGITDNCVFSSLTTLLNSLHYVWPEMITH
jgi:hypothetical protein